MREESEGNRRMADARHSTRYGLCKVSGIAGWSILHQVREEVHRLLTDAKVILHGSRVRNEARQDSDWDFLIIADRPLDREIITKLKDGLYDIELENDELENDEVVSSIIRGRQEWFSPEYDALPFKKAVEREGAEL